MSLSRTSYIAALLVAASLRADTPKPQPTQESKPAPTPAPAKPADVYFKNCTAAREAGAAPVHVGDPGYAKHLDRDGDGVGCE